MSIVQTVLVYVGIPAGIVAVLALGVYGHSLMRQSNRYRPGRPWRFDPVWYIPHPDQVTTLADSAAREALEAAGKPAIEAADQQVSTPAAVGGASGEW